MSSKSPLHPKQPELDLNEEKNDNNTVLLIIDHSEMTNVLIKIA
jgi:hypothetical protein